MEKKVRRQTKIRKDIPTLDLKEFNALTDLLFVAFKENNSACARILGISRPTWKKWSKEPPKEWWWNHVLRIAIKHLLAGMVARRRMTSKRHQQRIMQALAKVPQSKELQEEISSIAYDTRGAEAHLRRLLARRGMWLSEIRLAANCGGFTESALRKAARMAGLVRIQEVRDGVKDSYWRLPTEEDDG